MLASRVLLARRRKKLLLFYCTKKTFQGGVGGVQWHSDSLILVVVVLVGFALFADWDLDALRGE